MPTVSPWTLQGGQNNKRYWFGTQRICAPEETLARVRSIFPRVGITRLADITWLDNLGIPIYEAIRPNSRGRAVAHGKGLTPLLAKVSAVMESLEYYCAENLSRPIVRSAIGDMIAKLSYNPYDLPCAYPRLVSDDTQLEWVLGEELGTGKPTYLPTSVIDMSSLVADWWAPPLFVANSNGLASGNNLLEATVHALYELIERECVAAVTRLPVADRTYLDTSSIGGEGCELLEKFKAADTKVRIVDATNTIGVPCFFVETWSSAFPVRLHGAGCHLDGEIALCRALTEAAQSRAAIISGTRDDLAFTLRDLILCKAEPSITTEPPRRIKTITEVAAYPESADLRVDFQDLTRRIYSFTGAYPVGVDISLAELPIAATKVVATGLHFDAA